MACEAGPVNRPLTDKQVDRFMSKVKMPADVVTGCWEWRGQMTPKGYGQVSINDKTKAAHRVAFEMTGGVLRAGLHLDHLCKNRGCVNPTHLEQVTPSENAKRSDCVSAVNSRKTHCSAGHEFTPENTYWRKPGWGRQCKACNRDMARDRQRRLRRP